MVWAATIHQERTNRGTDEGVQGEKKEGLQTHLHVMVSARDADQKITLNPLGRADRFNRVQFQAEAVTQMEVQFGRTAPRDIAAKEPTRRQLVAQKVEEITRKAAANKKEKKSLTPEQMVAKDARLDGQVARVNSKLDPTLQLDPARVKEAAKERNYDQMFYDRLGKIERTAEKGGFTPQPYEYLTTGRVAQFPPLRTGRDVDPNREFSTSLPKQREEPEQAAGMQGLERSIKKLGTAMAPKGRTQDVRSDAEKEQEWEV